MKPEAYLDNAATTRPWPEVCAEMQRVLTADFGNAAARNARGFQAARDIERATAHILDLVGSGDWKVVFTSGATESDNLAIRSAAPKGPRTAIVTSTVDHAAVRECSAATCPADDLTLISAGASGVLEARAVADAITPQTALLAITAASNEMGTLQPVNDITAWAKARNPRLRIHVDAVQAVAQTTRLDFSKDIDTVALSAHKIHGPQGVGALLVRPGVSLRPQLFGGDQQSGLRPGTPNLPGIVGFGEAARLTRERREAGVRHMQALSAALIDGLLRVPGTYFLGNPQQRAPGLFFVAAADIPSEVLLHGLSLRGVIASAGSACHASRKEPARCLVEAGLKPTDGALRFSLSFDTTETEIHQAIRAFGDVCQAVRSGHTGGLHD